MYGNDAEIFDFRPGRYHTEAALAESGEWVRIERLFAAIAGDPRFTLIRPSEALALRDQPQAGHRLHLESAEDPTPVKKQRKYNITRWAVTGRDDLGINTACWRRYARSPRTRWPADADWRELCELWSSDYRTHITDARWAAYLEAAFESRRGGFRRRSADLAGPHEAARSARKASGGDPAVTRDGALLAIREDGVTLVLNCRRGLAIDALSFDALGGDPLCGTLQHGFYDDIHWGADFYTGMTVMESPGRPKLTDLNRVEPTVGRDEHGELMVEGTLPTELGPIAKTIRAPNASVELTYRLDWPEVPVGSLRLGDITLHPNAFDRATLFYRCHNGGVAAGNVPARRHARRPRRRRVVSRVREPRARHHRTASWSSAIAPARSASKWTRPLAALVGMVTYQPIRDSYFCRLSFSAAEVDETRRPLAADHAAPLTCRFVLTAFRPST